jgi:hypothetical protein
LPAAWSESQKPSIESQDRHPRTQIVREESPGDAAQTQMPLGDSENRRAGRGNAMSQ